MGFQKFMHVSEQVRVEGHFSSTVLIKGVANFWGGHIGDQNSISGSP